MLWSIFSLLEAIWYVLKIHTLLADRPCQRSVLVKLIRREWLIFFQSMHNKGCRIQVVNNLLSWKENFTGDNLISRFLLKSFSICSASQIISNHLSSHLERSSVCFPGYGVLLQLVLEKPNKKNAVRHDEKISEDLEHGFQKYGPDVNCHTYRP